MNPGYKQTEVGVIPEEWEVCPVSHLINSFRNGFAFTSEGYVGSGVPIVTMAQIGLDGGFNFSEASVNHWPVSKASRLASFQLFRGDVIIAMTDVTPQKNLIGRMTEVTEAGPLLLNQRVGLLRLACEKVNSYFLRAYSNSARWRSYARAIASLGVQANIGTKDILAGKIPLPPLPEQRAIAEALSDVDGLLGGLDRLIAKKRDLKQAAMQQLLTGQTRLPGFHGEWEVKTLRSVFEIMAGKSMSAYISDGGDFVICDMGSVSTEGRLIKTKRTNYRGDFLREGDLVMPKDDIGGGKIIGRVGYVDCSELYVLGDHVYRLRAIEGDPLFLSYLINSHSINSALRKKVIGSAQLGLGRRSVEEQEIPFPSTAEQTAIAQILSNMDAELTALEQRREKARALKQAMMQELLTGRTRLV